MWPRVLQDHKEGEYCTVDHIEISILLQYMGLAISCEANAVQHVPNNGKAKQEAIGPPLLMLLLSFLAGHADEFLNFLIAAEVAEVVEHANGDLVCDSLVFSI